jgi:hypothetical protein
VATKKNGVISRLFEQLGFARAERVDPDDTGVRWSLRVDDYRPGRTHIVRRSR